MMTPRRQRILSPGKSKVYTTVARPRQGLRQSHTALGNVLKNTPAVQMKRYMVKMFLLKFSVDYIQHYLVAHSVSAD